MTKFTPQNASAKHYSTGERVYAARGLLGSDQQFVVGRAVVVEGKNERGGVSGRKYADFLGRCGFSRDSRSFFFSPFLLFSLPQAFTIEKATRRRAKRRWTIENRNFVFARKNKTPLLVCRSGDHRCFSKRSKNLRASGENSRFSPGSSIPVLCYDDIYRWRGEKEREKERGEVLASKGKFPSRKLLVSLSLSVDGQEAF